MKRILLTGSSGFLGSHLYDALSADHEVIGLDIREGLNGDAFYAHTIEDIDLVYHLAAQTSVINSLENSTLDLRANVNLTLRLLSQYPTSRFIYTGSGGASEQETIISPYGLSKKVAGEYIKMLHKDYVICNLSNVYGRGGNGVIERFMGDDSLTIYGDGSQTRDFVHVSDVVHGLIQAAEWPKGEYFMGSEDSITIAELASKFNKPIRYESEREGELHDTFVANTTLDWKPVVTIDDYLTESFANDYCAKHGLSIAGKRCRWCIDDRVDALRR